MSKPKWWEFWKEEVIDHAPVIIGMPKTKEPEPEIGEPIREIVRLMIKDRKRFVIQYDDKTWACSEWTRVLILDLENGEEYRVSWTYATYLGMIASGLNWATQKEQAWAVTTILDHRRKLLDRRESIKNARERNRLIAIYNKD